VVLACVFYSLPTKELSGGFSSGRVYERGLILWIMDPQWDPGAKWVLPGPQLQQRGCRGHSQGRGDVRGACVVHLRPGGGDVGGSRGAKQVGPAGQGRMVYRRPEREGSPLSGAEITRAGRAAQSGWRRRLCALKFINKINKSCAVEWEPYNRRGPAAARSLGPRGETLAKG
jgi:hypothetical protein